MMMLSGAVVFLAILGGAVATGEFAGDCPWWKVNWAVRRDHGVDGLAVVLQALIVTKEVFRMWFESPDGMRRGIWKPNKKYYQLFTRTMHFLSSVQEVLFLQLEHTGVRKK